MQVLVEPPAAAPAEEVAEVEAEEEVAAPLLRRPPGARFLAGPLRAKRALLTARSPVRAMQLTTGRESFREPNAFIIFLT